jgi:hypothetical protein
MWCPLCPWHCGARAAARRALVTRPLSSTGRGVQARAVAARRPAFGRRRFEVVGVGSACRRRRRRRHAGTARPASVQRTPPSFRNCTPSRPQRTPSFGLLSWCPDLHGGIHVAAGVGLAVGGHQRVLLLVDHERAALVLRPVGRRAPTLSSVLGLAGAVDEAAGLSCPAGCSASLAVALALPGGLRFGLDGLVDARDGCAGCRTSGSRNVAPKLKAPLPSYCSASNRFGNDSRTSVSLTLVLMAMLSVVRNQQRESAASSATGWKSSAALASACSDRACRSAGATEGLGSERVISGPAASSTASGRSRACRPW